MLARGKLRGNNTACECPVCGARQDYNYSLEGKPFMFSFEHECVKCGATLQVDVEPEAVFATKLKTPRAIQPGITRGALFDIVKAVFAPEVVFTSWDLLRVVTHPAHIERRIGGLLRWLVNDGLLKRAPGRVYHFGYRSGYYHEVNQA